MWLNNAMTKHKSLTGPGNIARTHAVFWLILLPGVVLLCGCSQQKQQTQVPTQSPSKEQAKLEPPIVELKRLYETATSERDRRAVCLRAIDENAIHRGGSVSTIDEIFGTHFALELAEEKEGVRHAFVLFADQVSLPPRADGRAEGVSYRGSYMDLDYDSNGAIQNYYLSNLHKAGSRRTDGEEATSVGELKGLYEIAKSERERRDVAFRAIDEGVIQTFGPVHVSRIDAIFGTQLASQLPTKKESKRIGLVDFAPTSSNQEANGGAAGYRGWFMAVEYYSDGNIANYYLTNLHK
jgi:hypothetical protein